MRFQPKYSFSEEPAPLTERLNPQEEMKFGFTTNLFKPKAKVEADFSTLGLPQIDKKNTTLYEKSCRNDRLKSLRGQYGKMLKLADY